MYNIKHNFFGIERSHLGDMYNIFYRYNTVIYIFSPVCSHHYLESSGEKVAPRQCWSHYRSNLYTDGQAEKQEEGSCVQVFVCVYVYMYNVQIHVYM